MKKFTLLIFMLCGFLTTMEAQFIQSDTFSYSRNNVTGKKVSAGAEQGPLNRNVPNVDNVLFNNMAPVVITQSVSQNIVPNNSVACPGGDDSFFRDFDLANDFGIAGDFEVTSAEFGVEESTGLTVTINIYSSPTGLPGGTLTLQGTADYASSAADNGTVVSVPLSATIPAGEVMVMELFSPDFTNTADFYPGSNAAGQNSPTYIQSAFCGAATPTDVTTIGFPDMHLVFNVVGEEVGGGGPFPDPYCGPLEFNSGVEPITLVEVAGISNVSDPVLDGSPAHEDFTAIEGDMEEGMSYPIALEGNTGGGFTNSFTVFIDWNQDGILDNASERYEIGTIFGSTGTDGQQATGNILVPAGVADGPTRLRVIKRFQASYATDSCTPGSGFGQAEDYTVNVTTAGGGSCTSTAYNSTAVPFDIDGAGTTTVDCANAPNLIPITVSEMGTIGSGAILENITIDIAHTFSADLDLYLISPSGTELLLANDLGGGTDNGYNGTMFEDGGADITLATAPFGVGPYEPMGGAFATAFAGEDINGDWNLKVCDDAGGDSGQVLQFSMSICVPPVFTNDDCANAFALACGDSVVGETLTATDSGGNAAPDVFYKFTGNGSTQLVTISLCGGGTDYDSALRVFDDCDLANELAFNDDACGLQSEVTFVSDGTSTYYIMVEGFGSNAGNFTLDVSCTQPLPNDDCSGAIAVSCGDSVTGTTVGATVDSTAPVCGPAITSPGVWYSLNDDSGLPGDITVSLCNGTDFDSKISIYSGTCGALVCVDGNDDSCGLQSEVTFASDGNTQYYILIHSFGGATGNFTLDVSCMPTPPPNDMIVNSIDVDEIGLPYTDPAVAMPAATTENGNPQNCDLTGANGVWYNFVSAGDGTAMASITTPGGASAVTFYTAPDENAVETDLVLVPQNSNQCVPGTSASITTVAGQAYYVFVLNSGAVTDIVIDGTNLGVSENSIAGFNYYPNPTTGVLNLKSVKNIERVSLYNLLGQRVVDRSLEATTSQLDISGLSSGTYLMKVTVEGQTGTYKILKN